MANALLTLILQRLTPQAITPEFTFDHAVETLILLLNTIRDSGLVPDDRLHNYFTTHTPAQIRVIVYFRICGKLRMAEQLAAFYDESKARGVPFTRLMYTFAIRGVSHDFRVFSTFSSKVLRDIGRDKDVPDEGILKSFLRGWYITRNVDELIPNFKILERT